MLRTFVGFLFECTVLFKNSFIGGFMWTLPIEYVVFNIGRMIKSLLKKKQPIEWERHPL